MSDNGSTEQNGADNGTPESVGSALLTLLRGKGLRKAGTDILLEALKQSPVVGGLVSVGEKVLTSFHQLQENTRRERLIGYLAGLHHIRREDLPIRQDDLLAVIRKLQEDDEWAKLEYYVRLTVSLAESDLSEEMRYHFITMISGLTCFQIEFARALYIRKTIPLKGYLSCEEAERALIYQKNGLTIRAVTSLTAWGLIREYRERGTNVQAEPPYELMEEMTTLMTLLFHPDDLQPAAINLEAKATADVILIRGTGPDSSLYETYLQSALREAGLTVKVVEHKSDHRHHTYAPLYIQTRLQEASDGSRDRYISICMTRSPERPPIKLESPDGSFNIPEAIFRQTASDKGPAKQKLREKLGSVVWYVSQLRQAKP